MDLNRVMDEYDLEVKLTAVNPMATEPVVTNQERVIESGGRLSLNDFSFMAVLVIFILMLTKALQLINSKNSAANGCHTLPCRNCYFFTNNYHLRCTVHPDCVLTRKALDCPDYRPLNKN